ncbi:GSCOCG00010657001-RA-CDS [Cotesia congregata]|nr:GSCOCG00010657001-RA-CDS [Cotesia congregata]
MADDLINTVKSPILVINEDFLPRDTQLYYPTHPLYILLTDTTGQLRNLLMLLKSSPFWNMKSTFFVIGKANKFCRDSAAILKEMWKFELLSSFVVCSKTNNQTMLYTYNPYTSRVPLDSWVAVRNKENSNRRWTLYKKAFINDPRICKSFNFDKTKFMNGYPVKIIKSDNIVRTLENLVFSSLNMKVKVHVHDEVRHRFKMAHFLNFDEDDIVMGLYNTHVLYKRVNEIPVLYEYNYLIITQKRSFTYSFREVVVTLDYHCLVGYL